MNDRNKIYDKLSATLTDYEQNDIEPTEAMEMLYKMLVEIQVNWESVITADE